MSTQLATRSLLDERCAGARALEIETPRLRVVDSHPGAANAAASRPHRGSTSNDFGTSRFNKSGVFALVVLGHVALFLLLTTLRVAPTANSIETTQVVVLAEQQSEVEVPKPAPPKIEVPQFEVPLVPVVIDIATPDSNAITVAQRPEATSIGVANTGTPKEVSSVEYVREPAAKYPASAQALKQRGIVTVRALVDAEGHAREVKLHRSSGFKILDDAARTAVLNALFKPYAEDGRFIPVYVLIPIEFGAKG